MRVGVVLARLVMAVVARRRQAVEPLDELLLQAALLVVHPDAGRDVHGGHETEPLDDSRRRHDLRYALGDVDELAACARVEPEVLGVRAHHATTASASISTSAASLMSRATWTIEHAGRTSRKNSPCTRPITSACPMSTTKMRVRITWASVPPRASMAAWMISRARRVCAAAPAG